MKEAVKSSVSGLEDVRVRVSILAEVSKYCRGWVDGRGDTGGDIDIGGSEEMAEGRLRYNGWMFGLICGAVGGGGRRRWRGCSFSAHGSDGLILCLGQHANPHGGSALFPGFNPPPSVPAPSLTYPKLSPTTALPPPTTLLVQTSF